MKQPKQTLIKVKLVGVSVSLLFSFAQVAYAVPWSETTSTIYTTDVNKSVGIGTTTPTYELHAVSNQSSTDPYYFVSNSTTTGERDIFTIRDSDSASSTQDESSVLKVMKSQTINNSADAFTLLELSHTTTLPTVADRQFYVLGRGGNDEGQAAWGISLTDADFWTQGSIRGGAVGTNCGGTGTACFSNPTFQFSASGNSYINGGNVGIGTASPGSKLSVVAGADTWAASFFGLGTADQVRLGSYGGVATVGANNSVGSAWANLALNPGGGNVGVGTTSPAGRLETVGQGGLDALILNYSGGRSFGMGPGTGTGDGNKFGIYDRTAATTRLVIDNSGNVGIGTTNPSSMLDLNAVTAAQSSLIMKSNTDGGAIMRLERYGNNGSYFHIETGAANNDTLAFHRGSSPYADLVIGNNGYVGIGTQSPSDPLTINAGTNDAIALLSDTNNDWYLGPNVGSGSGFGIYDADNSAVRLKIDTSGNVGIGTAYPGSKLSVVAGSDTWAGSFFGLDTADQVRLGTYGGVATVGANNSTGSAWAKLALNPGGGNVGVGTTNPTEKLDVSGNINASGTICDSVGCIGSSSSSSGLTGSGTNSYIAKWTNNTNLGNSLIYDNGTNVGINTSSPDKKLTVGGNLRIDNKLYGPSSDALSLYSESSRAIKFYTNGSSERMRISADGYVGINADPDSDYSLRVDNNSNADDTAAIAGHSWADTGNTIGVYGITDSDGIGSGSPAGVFGWAIRTGPGGDTFGVLGRTSTQGGSDPNVALDDTAVAVYGEAVATSGMSMGVWGETFSSTSGASGVRGVANVPSGPGVVVYGVHGSAPTPGYAVYASGTLSTSGAKPAVVYTEMQGPTELYSIESPDIWFEDIRFAQLKDGRAHIELDPLFRQTVTIDENNPFHVFLQSYDAESNEQLTVHKNEDSFDVISVGNPKSNILFSYRVMAKRHFYEDRHLKAVEVPVDVHMRPDLSQDQIDTLNQQLKINYIPQKSQPIDIGDISDHRPFNEQSDLASE